MHTNVCSKKFAYLVEVDHGLPELVLGLVEVAHTDFTEVTRMVLVEVGTVVVLTTGHTTTTWMLAVLADTTVSGRDVAAAVKELGQSIALSTHVRACLGFLAPAQSAKHVERDSLLAGLAQSSRHID